MEKEHMFDKDSFTSEITTAAEAQSAYNYYTHNLTTFQHELASEGKSYEQMQETLRQCWLNLVKSSHRVGFTNDHLERIAKNYGQGANKALPKTENK
jgi:L-rhamnose isomerase